MAAITITLLLLIFENGERAMVALLSKMPTMKNSYQV